MKIENLLNHIKENDYKYCRMIDNKNNQLSLFSKNENSNILVGKIKKFTKYLEPGNYTFILKYSDNSPADHECKLIASIGEDNEIQINGANNNFDIEQIKKDIELTIRNEYKQQELKNEIAEKLAAKDEEIKNLRDPIYKLSQAATIIFKNVPQFKSLNGLLNGIQPEPGGNKLNLVDDNEDWSPEELEQIDEATNIYLEYLSPAQYSELAKNVQLNPGLINQLKIFKLIS